MKTIKAKVMGKEWTLKVGENQTIPETDSTFKSAILIPELGQFYYDINKRIFYLEPPKKISKLDNNLKISLIIYKLGFAIFHLNKELTYFDIEICGHGIRLIQETRNSAIQ